ncbi:hypothetical protein [Oceanithermus sp.]
MQDFQDGLRTVAAAASQDLALQALMATPPGAPGLPAGALAANLMQLGASPLTPDGALKLLGGLVPLADQNLERGKWDYDPNIPGWVEDNSYTGDDLVFTWPFRDYDGGSHTAQLDFNWNAEAQTVDVRGPDGTTREVPQGMEVTLKVDGDEAGSLRGLFAWYSCDGTLIAEPTSVALSGSAGVSDRVGFNFDLRASDTFIESSGSIEVTAGGNRADLSWEVSASGQLTRGTDCFFEDFDAGSGHIDFRTSETVGGDTSSFEFNTNFSLNFNAFGGLDSAELSNGFVMVDGSVAVTFSGTLDDSNHNCIPGENVTLNFADRSTSLEDYLISEWGARPCPY